MTAIEVRSPLLLILNLNLTNKPGDETRLLGRECKKGRPLVGSQRLGSRGWIRKQKEGGSYLDRGHRRFPLFFLSTARDFRDRLGFRLNTAESADFFSFRQLSTTSGKSLFL